MFWIIEKTEQCSLRCQKNNAVWGDEKPNNAACADKSRKESPTFSFFKNKIFDFLVTWCSVQGKASVVIGNCSTFSFTNLGKAWSSCIHSNCIHSKQFIQSNYVSPFKISRFLATTFSLKGWCMKVIFLSKKKNISLKMLDGFSEEL